MPTLKKPVEQPKAEPERKRSSWRWVTLTSRGFARACVGAVNLVLALCATLLFLVLGLSYFDRELPIPASIIQRAANSLEERGLRPRWDSLSVDLTGRIHLRNLRVLDAQTEDTLLTADAALVHVDPFLLCFGRLNLIDIQVEGAAFHAPAIISDSGRSTELINEVTASIDLSGITPVIRHLQGRLDTLHVVAHGAVPVVQREPSEQPPLITSIIRAAGLLLRYKPYLAHVNTPVLFADLDKEELTLTAKTAQWDNWFAEDPIVHLRLGADLRPRHAQVSGASIEGPSLSGALWHASARWGATAQKANPSPYDFSPSAIHVHTTGLKAVGQQLEGLSVFSSDSHVWTINTLFADEPVAAVVHVESDGFAIQTEGSVLMTPLLNAAGLPVEQILSRFRVHAPIRFSANAFLDRDAKLKNTQFHAELRDVDARGTLMDYISASGHASPDRLVLDSVSARKGNEHAEGSFYQDLKTLDWRLLIRGYAYPEGLGPMLGSWWDSIWPGFEFPGPPLQADLDLRGNWNDTSYADVAGHIEGSGIVYNGVHVEEGSLDLWGGSTFVLLHNMDLKQEHGHLGGHILLRYPLDPTAPRSINFDIFSTAPLSIVNQAFQANLDNLIDEFTLEDLPRLHMFGDIVQTRSGWHPLLQVEAEAGRGSWRSITFDELRLRAHHDALSTRIRNMEAKLLGGRGTGEITFTNNRGETEVAFSVQMNLTHLHSTVLALQTLGEENPQPVFPDDRKGRLDLSLAGTSLLSDFEKNLRAHGRGEVSQADLGTIRLFGELSEAFTGLGISFTRFAFERGVGNFEIHADQMTFRDVAIFGQNANIEADGRMNLKNSAMDFDVRVFLLRGDTPSILDLVGVLLSPLGYALELQLTGTMDAPNWRLKIDPRNLFAPGISNRDNSRTPLQSPTSKRPYDPKRQQETPAQ